MAELSWTEANWIEFGWVDGSHQSPSWVECGWFDAGWVEGDVCDRSHPEFVSYGGGGPSRQSRTHPKLQIRSSRREEEELLILLAAL